MRAPATRALNATLSALLVASACLGALGARRPAQGGSFLLPTDSPLRSLDPIEVRWPAEATLASLLYDSPYRLDAGGRPSPHLLYPVNATAGGRVLRLKVRQHAVFHDGDAVRASHVVDSLARLARSSQGWLLAMVEGGEKGISVAGSNTVQLRLVSSPALDLLVHALAAPQAGIVPSTRKAAKGVGSGPFILREKRGEDRTLRANRDYFDGPPYLSEVQLLGAVSRDDHIRRFQLEKADASLLGTSVYGEEPPIKGIAEVDGPSVLLSYLLFNTAKGPARDLPLRRAVDLALDRRRLAGTAAEALGLPGQKAPTTPDVVRARALIGGLGLGSASRPLVLLAEEEDAFGAALAPMIERDLSAAGLTVDAVIAKASEVRTRLAAGTWDLRLQTVSPVGVDEVLLLGQILALGGLEADAARLVQKAPGALGEEVSRAQTLLATQLPALPLCRRRPQLHVRSSLRGVVFDRLGRLDLANIWRRSPAPGGR